MARSTWSLQDVVAASAYARLARRDRVKRPSFTEHLLNMPTDDGAFERLARRRREALDWLAARRVGAKCAEDAGAFVSKMRDENER